MNNTPKMEKLHSLQKVFTSYYSQLKNVEIETVEYNNNYIARCIAEPVGDYIHNKTKERLMKIVPQKILITDVAMKKKQQDLIFLFIHECAHGITPRVERLYKNKYVRTDHSRHFYENFFTLIQIAYQHNYLDHQFSSIEELMTKDNRKENIKNDRKLYLKL